MARSALEARRLHSAMAGHTGDGNGPSTSTSYRTIQHHARKRSLSLLGSSGSTPPHQSKGRNASTILAGGHSKSAGRDDDAGSGSVSSITSSSPPARFTTRTSDFHLPKRSQSSTPQPSGSTPSVGTSPLSASRGDTDYVASNTSMPLLRRAAAAAVFASANRMRLRRGSMLGREVARNAEVLTSSDEDEAMDGAEMNDEYDDEERRRRRQALSDLDVGASLPAAISLAGRKGRTSAGSAGRDNGDDDIMQIETGDVSLENVKLDSRSRPTTPPPASTSSAGAPSPGTLLDGASSSSSQARGVALRRGGGRSRGQNTVRDRGMLRVAESLRDEARPSDSEIASEAKLQRKLGPESESLTPTTPRLQAVGAARSPTTSKRPSAQALGAGAAAVERNALDDDDMIFHDHFDPYDAADSSDEEDFASASIAKSHAPTAADEEALASCVGGEGAVYAGGIAIPGATPRDQLWLGFRETTPGFGVRNSPGAERVLGKARPSTAGAGVAPPAAVTTPTLSTSFGSQSFVDTAMETDQSSTVATAATAMTTVNRTPGAMSSPSVWGRTTKRKLESDRYEPYSASLYKRRAVSPIAAVTTAATIATAAGAFQRRRSNTPTMVTGQSPLLTAVLSQQSPLLTYQTGNSHALPVPTPLSIPSPTLSVTRGSTGGGGYLGAGGSGSALTYAMYSKSMPAAMAMVNSAGGGSASASGSPNSTRPSTPTHSGAALSTVTSSLYGTSSVASAQGPSGTPGAAGSSSGGAGGGSGSGPGYGSGALGLSLGRGSRRFKEEQEEQEEQEDMLDDVNAIRL